MRNTTVYGLGHTKTFRRASFKFFKKWGSNLQNVKKELREIYISDGYSESLKEKCLFWLKYGDTSIFTEEELETLRVFVATDQAGAEALIVAYDCEALDYRKLFLNNIKVHVYIALKLFKEEWKKEVSANGLVVTGKDIDELYNTRIEDLKKNPYWKDIDSLIKSSDEWPTHKRYYYLAKQTVHSSNYGIEWHTFIMNVLEKSAGQISLTKQQGERFLQTNRALFPEIPERCRRVKAQVERTRIIYNMFGFPFFVTNENLTDNKMKEMYAWGPQSTVGEITRIATTNLQRYIETEKKRWDFLVDNHDSYMHQCPLRDTLELVKKQQEYMNIQFISPIDGAVFNMKSETKIGFNWGNYDKRNPDKNPMGLREVEWN